MRIALVLLTLVALSGIASAQHDHAPSCGVGNGAGELLLFYNFWYWQGPCYGAFTSNACYAEVQQVLDLVVGPGRPSTHVDTATPVGVLHVEATCNPGMLFAPA